MAKKISSTEKDLSERQQKALAILDVIRRGGPLAKTDISKATEINIVTVSSYVDHFIELGLVVEKGLGHSTGGRIPTLIDLNRQSGFVVGIGWTLTDLCGVVTDLSGTIIHQQRIPKPTVINEDIVRQMIEFTEQLMSAGKIDPKKVRGIGVGIPGIIDEEGHRIHWPHPPVGSADIFLNVSLRDSFEQRFGIPAMVLNDADAAVFGEKWFSTEYDREYMLYMYSGVSCGIIIDGKVYGGRDGWAGELGIYNRRAPQETLEKMKPGLGRWDTDLSIVAMTRKAIEGGAQSAVTEIVGGDLNKLDFRVVLQAAEKGDAVALDQIRKGGEAYGKKNAFLENLLNPELIVIGGGIEIAKHLLLDTIRETVKDWAFEEATQSLKIIPSRLGDSAIAIGAACLMIRNIYMEV
ncbi:MAG: ROK family transcriptional regulator [Candidatus Omnitrophica bacterium]|nr:ROK family transcriptional regulator [Candidatus Omnitrophota bacterium]